MSKHITFSFFSLLGPTQSLIDLLALPLSHFLCHWDFGPHLSTVQITLSLCQVFRLKIHSVGISQKHLLGMLPFTPAIHIIDRAHGYSGLIQPWYPWYHDSDNPIQTLC